MSYVTVVARNGENFSALPEPAYIIRVPVPGGDDQYIVTKAIWVYANSAPGELHDGWESVKNLYEARSADPGAVLNAVDVGAFDVGGGQPVQTDPNNQ